MASGKEKDIALEILARCSAGRVRQMARIVTARFDQKLARFGVTASQLTMLSMIAKMGPVGSGDMLPYLQMDQSTLSRNLDRLVRNGWVEARPSEQDARVRELTLSEQGSSLLRDAYKGWKEAQSWADEKFGAEGAASLKTVATTLNPLLP